MTRKEALVEMYRLRYYYQYRWDYYGRRTRYTDYICERIAALSNYAYAVPHAEEPRESLEEWEKKMPPVDIAVSDENFWLWCYMPSRAKQAKQECGGKIESFEEFLPDFVEDFPPAVPPELPGV